MASSPSTICPLQMVTCRPCHSKDMALSGLVTLTFDLLTLELVRNVSRGTDFFLPILVFLRLFISELWVMGKQASDWQYDLITLTCDLWRHRACRWCSSSYSIPVPSLKFVGLHFRRYGAFSISALIALETLTFNLSTSKWGSRIDFFSANFELATPFHSRFMVRHGTDRQTNRRRPSTLHAPTLWDGGSTRNILWIKFVSFCWNWLWTEFRGKRQ